VLIDAGPLIALFDADDRYHKHAVGFLKQSSAELNTTWPVVTETCHMLDFSRDAQIGFLEWVHRDGLRIHELHAGSLARIIELTRKYHDRPMDLADASLVVASEALGILDVISIDSDFNIYRRGDGRAIRNLFAL
jgi:predicted nucleic acid-binding protein